MHRTVQNQNWTANQTMPSTVFRDSEWLTLEVCREHQRNKCKRDENSCRYAHPPSGVEIHDGRVVCCFDFIKGRCQRHMPPCKYFHPPPHLKDQLIQNGRNNLIWKKIRMQTVSQSLLHLVPAVYPWMANGMTGCCNASFPASMEVSVPSIPASVPGIGWMGSIVPAVPDQELTSVEESTETACSSSGDSSPPSISFQNQYWNGNLVADVDGQSNQVFYQQPYVQGVTPGGVSWIAVPQMMKPQVAGENKNCMATEYQHDSTAYQQMSLPWFPVSQFPPCYFTPNSLSCGGIYQY